MTSCHCLPLLKSKLFAISHRHWILCLDGMEHQEPLIDLNYNWSDER